MPPHRTILSVLATVCVALTGSANTLRAQAIQAPMLVSGEGSGNILRYDGETGAFIDRFVPTGVGGLCQGLAFGPGSMIFGPDGNLYVSCGIDSVGFVMRYDGRSGVPLHGPLGTPGRAEFIRDDSGSLIRPLGFDFGPDGNLYVASTGAISFSPGDADRVLRYDGETGAFIDTFVPTSSGALDGPSGLVFGPDGHLYVSSLNTDQVLRYDGTTGIFMDVFASSGGGVSIDQPTHLQFGPDGNLYVSGTRSNNVARFDGQTGAPIGNFVPPGFGGLDHPLGLRFGPDANLYVASWTDHRVIRYDGQTGAFIDSFVTTGSGGLDSPSGLVFFPTPPCEMGGGQDCNHNGIDDTCELREETSFDNNGDGVPDECDCFPSGQPRPDVIRVKNRYLSFRAGDPGRSQAVRVTFIDLPGAHAALNGTVLWVGLPNDVSELAGKDDNTPPTFQAATLGCLPSFLDWGPLGTVHVHHEGVVPGGIYDIQVVDQNCDVASETSFSVPLTLTQSKWADVCGPFSAGSWTPPDGSVAVTFDVVAVLDKFSNRPGAPLKSRADIEPGVPDQKINITDVTRGLDAFSGQTFPFAPSDVEPCP